MLTLLSELVAEWRQRLSECRRSLSAVSGDSPHAQYLRIHERILKYLLDRYQQAEPEPPPLMSVVRRTRRFPPPLPLDLPPSSLHPPRGRAELRSQLRMIHQALHRPQRRWWHGLFRSRPPG
ncbi:MAG: hypothetical protein QM783_02565 [Phycisphaerales bacterium]